MNQQYPSQIQLVLISSVFLWLFPSCEKEELSVIDSIGVSPILSSGILTPNIVNTDSLGGAPIKTPEDVLTINTSVTVKAVSQNGASDIELVLFELRNIKSASVLASGVLLDDGNPPDAGKGDSVYSASLSFKIVRSNVGNFPVEVLAENPLGFRSNSLILPLAITRSNNAPMLSELQAPDTVRPSTQSSFIITVRGSDVDGLSDIVTVRRTTAQGNTYPLNDSGVNGDQTAGDGIFTETVDLSPPPNPGNYTFRFQAFDQLNFGSNIITKVITVVQ